MSDPAPFQVLCPTCGRDSDAKDTEFLFTAAVPFAGSEYLLAGITCSACATRQDLALWPVDTAAPEAATGGPEAGEPEAIGLRARYRQCLVAYCEAWGYLYKVGNDKPLGERTIDLSDVTLTTSDTRRSVVDMRILAAPQACREVALRFPGQDSAGMLLAGPFRCALTLDRMTGSAEWVVLHLSVSHALGLGRLQRLEEAVLTRHYFTGDERPGLHEEAGHFVPCTHFRYVLPASQEGGLQ